MISIGIFVVASIVVSSWAAPTAPQKDLQGFQDVLKNILNSAGDDYQIPDASDKVLGDGLSLSNLHFALDVLSFNQSKDGFMVWLNTKLVDASFKIENKNFAVVSSGSLQSTSRARFFIKVYGFNDDGAIIATPYDAQFDILEATFDVTPEPEFHYVREVWGYLYGTYGGRSAFNHVLMRSVEQAITVFNNRIYLAKQNGNENASLSY